MHLVHQTQIVGVAVKEIAGMMGVVTRLDFAFGTRESIPDRWAFAVGLVGTFDLVSGCRNAPPEMLAKCGAVYYLFLVAGTNRWGIFWNAMLHAVIYPKRRKVASSVYVFIRKKSFALV
jgi:hypothetical protein